MTTLRDMNFRWNNDELPPDWFRRTPPAEYSFYRNLALLKIQVPGFVKINVYCVGNPEPYWGEVFDKVTNVYVQIDAERLAGLKSDVLVDEFIALMAKGVKIVLDFFGIPSDCVDEVAANARAEMLEPIIFGRESVKGDTRLSSVKLEARTQPNFEACVLSVVVFKGRKAIGKIPFCTTFPIPELAPNRLEEVKWAAPGHVIARFSTPDPAGMTRFGRENFDFSGFDHVSCRKTPEPPFSSVELEFLIDVSPILLN